MDLHNFIGWFHWWRFKDLVVFTPFWKIFYQINLRLCFDVYKCLMYEIRKGLIFEHMQCHHNNWLTYVCVGFLFEIALFWHKCLTWQLIGCYEYYSLDLEFPLIVTSKRSEKQKKKTKIHHPDEICLFTQICKI